MSRIKSPKNCRIPNSLEEILLERRFIYDKEY